jgi:2-polyprenyl-3-methyl-5-hydroxy-6-metoxy-1,4-benzoquinol methylase/predicted RNA-binding Zn-ribbon protein involved in translation (DUF1610 family)
MSDAAGSTGYERTPSLSELNAKLIEEMRTWQRVRACPVCDSASIVRFAVVRHFEHSRCQTCGFTFANPFPPQGLLDAFYNSEFYANYRRFEAARIAHDPYFSMSMYTDMSRLASWLGEDKSRSVLDFGCGPGAFLAFIRDRHGFADVEGIELSSRSVEFARRQYQLAIASSAAQLRHTQYDLVVLIEVIEHVPNPTAFFHQVASLVKPGGRILITTPAVDSFVGRFFPSLCGHYTAPSHVSLFTMDSMKRLLANFDFLVERLEVDERLPTLDQFAESLLYRMDFLSPAHDADGDDILKVPNALGRWLGLEKERAPAPGVLRRVLRRLDKTIGSRVLRRLSLLPKTVHLYVLARKQR